MKHVVVDLDLCQGYGNCVSAAPEVFDLGDDGRALLLKKVVETPEDERAVKAAIPLCPMAAISAV